MGTRDAWTSLPDPAPPLGWGGPAGSDVCIEASECDRVPYADRTSQEPYLLLQLLQMFNPQTRCEHREEMFITGRFRARAVPARKLCL